MAYISKKDFLVTISAPMIYEANNEPEEMHQQSFIFM